MGKGHVLITNELVHNALDMPTNWKIESIVPTHTDGTSSMLISGPEFPSVNGRGEAENVRLIIHVEQRRYEVKKIEGE